MKSNKNREEALSAYMSACARVEEMAAELAAFAADHGKVAPDDVTWATVGDMRHIEEMIEEARRFSKFASEM